MYSLSVAPYIFEYCLKSNTPQICVCSLDGSLFMVMYSASLNSLSFSVPLSVLEFS